MPRIPGTFRDNIPPNLVWNLDKPPIKNSCNEQVGMHAPDCDGTCEGTPISELEMDLINEHLEWARLGLAPTSPDVFQIDVMLRALMSVLDIDDEQFQEAYKKVKLSMMHDIRVANEDKIKRTRYGVPGVLGPDGNPLH